MKILILANSSGGLFGFRGELISEMVKQNTVVASIPLEKKVQELTELGCRLVDTQIDRRGMNPIKDFKLFLFYLMLLKKEKPDIVFTYTIKPTVYGGIACQLTHTAYVSNITGLGTAVENGGLLQKITLTLYRFGLRKAQKVFFQNTENRDFMLNHHVVKTPYDMLPGSGVNLNRYEILPYPNGETVDFVFISRIMREKGIDQYLDAAKFIRKKYPETRFHVCGSCEQNYEEELQKLHEDGTIIYHGHVSDIAGMHRISSCTIHPTYYPEGLSNVLLESCACGRPIITTDRSGCREVVVDGVNGFVVKQKDSQDLIKKIEQFLALDWESKKQMGLAGRRKVEDEFDRQIVIEKYMNELAVCSK